MNLAKQEQQSSHSTFSSPRYWCLNSNEFQRHFITSFSREWCGVTGSLRWFSQYRIGPLLVAQMGIFLEMVTMLLFWFIGAGNCSSNPSNKLRNLDQAMKPSFLSSGAQRRSFKNIRLLFSAPFHANWELAGLLKTRGRIFRMGICCTQKHLPHSPSPLFFRTLAKCT